MPPRIRETTKDDTFPSYETRLKNYWLSVLILKLYCWISSESQISDATFTCSAPYIKNHLPFQKKGQAEKRPSTNPHLWHGEKHLGNTKKRTEPSTEAGDVHYSESYPPDTDFSSPPVTYPSHQARNRWLGDFRGLLFHLGQFSLIRIR